MLSILNTIIAQKLCKELGLSEKQTRHYVKICARGWAHMSDYDDYERGQAVIHLINLGLIEEDWEKRRIYPKNINYFYLKENIEYALMFENIDNAN
jgi:hypothetical protein